MEENRNQKQESLTVKTFLDTLVKYNEEVLFPFLDERFVTKTEFQGLKTEFHGLKTEFHEFKDESLTGQDKILKKLDVLLDEKEVRQYQEEKAKKMWAIVIRALKEHSILSSKELEEIAQLEIF